MIQNFCRGATRAHKGRQRCIQHHLQSLVYRLKIKTCHHTRNNHMEQTIIKPIQTKPFRIWPAPSFAARLLVANKGPTGVWIFIFSSRARLTLDLDVAAGSSSNDFNSFSNSLRALCETIFLRPKSARFIAQRCKNCIWTCGVKRAKTLTTYILNLSKTNTLTVTLVYLVVFCCMGIRCLHYI